MFLLHPQIRKLFYFILLYFLFSFNFRFPLTLTSKPNWRIQAHVYDRYIQASPIYTFWLTKLQWFLFFTRHIELSIMYSTRLSFEERKFTLTWYRKIENAAEVERHLGENFRETHQLESPFFMFVTSWSRWDCWQCSHEAFRMIGHPAGRSFSYRDRQSHTCWHTVILQATGETAVSKSSVHCNFKCSK